MVISNLTKRVVSKGAEKELFHLYNLCNEGEIELVDYLGGDDSVEYAATMGLGKNIFNEKPSQSDLINYLAKKKLKRFLGK